MAIAALLFASSFASTPRFRLHAPALLALALGLSACSGGGGGDGDDNGGSGGASAASGMGGATPQAGSGGTPQAGSGGTPQAGSGGVGGDPSPPACDPMNSTLGRIDTPSPLISVGKAITASAGVANPERLVDGLYRNGSSAFGSPTADEPSWVAIEVGEGPSRLMLMWDDTGFVQYNVTSGGAPRAYTVETSGDSTDGEDGTWDVVATVEANPVRVRAHSFDFEGKSWVRLVVTEASPGANQCSSADPEPCVRLEEIALFDVSAAGDERPQDTWFFMGDSITQGGFARNHGRNNFDAKIHAMLPDYTPIALSGGIGGEFARDGANHLAEFLELNPDFQHVAIAYGTNDAWGNQNAAGVGFEATLRGMVETILAEGRVPILARIPYASVAHTTLPAFNAIIDRLSTEYELPCGPDLYGWFRDNPEDLSSDGVHPSGFGYSSLVQVWADNAAALYPAP